MKNKVERTGWEGWGGGDGINSLEHAKFGAEQSSLN